MGLSGSLRGSSTSLSEQCEHFRAERARSPSPNPRRSSRDAPLARPPRAHRRACVLLDRTGYCCPLDTTGSLGNSPLPLPVAHLPPISLAIRQHPSNDGRKSRQAVGAQRRYISSFHDPYGRIWRSTDDCTCGRRSGVGNLSGYLVYRYKRSERCCGCASVA